MIELLGLLLATLISTLRSRQRLLLESVPLTPDVAIGHSLGAVVLPEAVAPLRPTRAVYVDPRGTIGPDPEQGIAEFSHASS